MYTLSNSAFYHDSAACHVHDGEIIAAAQEERFTRKKRDPVFLGVLSSSTLPRSGSSLALN